MAGFGEAMQEQQQGPVTGPAPVEAAGGEVASPEEQQLYEKFVSMALLHIYNEKTLPTIIERMKEGDNPRQSIGEVAAGIGFAVMKKAQAAGESIPGEIILHGGQEVVSALVEIYEKGSGEEMSEGDINGAYYVAADEFRELAEGEGMIDPEALAGDMQSFQAMEEDGSLAAMMQQLQGAQ